MLKLFKDIKCMLGFHQFEEVGTIWSNPNFSEYSVEKKCMNCKARKSEFLNKYGVVTKVFII